MTDRCRACHRSLSDPQSIQRGLGNVCAKKAGLVEVKARRPVMRLGGAKANRADEKQLWLFEI